MTRRNDPLAKLLVDAALELHRARLWETIDGDELLLARVPTEEEPVAVSVMGQAGQEFGVTVIRGPGAYARTAQAIASPTEDDVLREPSAMVGYSFGAWDAVPPEFRELLVAAGLRRGTASAVPWVLAKAPYEVAGPPGRDELRTLAWVVQGLLAAHRAGELAPPRRAGRQRRVLALEISGDLRRPSWSVRLERPPSDPGEPEGPALVALPPDLRRLPRTSKRWALAVIATPATIEGDRRYVSFALLVEEGGLVVGNEVLQGDELAPLAGMLGRAFRGEEKYGTPGLPGRIAIEDERVHAALAPALAALGIESVLEEHDDELRGMIDELVEELVTVAGAAPVGEDAGPLADREPADLLEWKDADRRAIDLLVDEIEDGRLDTPRARKRFFGGELEQLLVRETSDRGMFTGALTEWVAADYRATKRSRTLVERLLERTDLDPGVRAMLAARRDATVSIFRVDACHPGATIEVEDVLTGRRATLHDRALSGSVRAGIFVPLRLLHAGPWTFPSIAGPALAPQRADAALAELERLGHGLDPASGRHDAHLFGRLFTWVAAQDARPILLQNTDGDPLLLHRATFRVTDGKALARALERRADVDGGDDATWVWLRYGRSPAGGEGNTVLAHLELEGDRLVLEVNSARRLAATREWIDALPGVRFERVTTRPFEHGRKPPAEPPAVAPAPMEPADVERLRRFALEVARRWVDLPVPLLGDLTPRQACASAAGRRRVERLVRTMPPIGTPAGPIPPPRAELLRELGIGASD